jgi:hypothetical protein
MTWTRGRLVGVACAAMSVLLLVGVGVTYVLSTRAAVDVRVTPASLQCIRPSDDAYRPMPWVVDTTQIPGKDATSTAAFAERGEPRDPGFFLTVDTRDMQCTMVLDVTNRGSIPVKVRAVRFYGWADEPSTRDDWVVSDEGTGAAVRAVGEERQDAAYVVDETLGAGDFARVEMDFQRRHGVCRSGGQFVSRQRPEIEVSTLGWRSSLDSDLTLATWFVPSLMC